MIGVFGGTFNPVHRGHLRLARQVLTRLGLSHIRMIPCGRPPHRETPDVSGELRLQMLRAAIQDVPELVADDREIICPGRSYMVDTLASLKQDFQQPLCLIIGADAFAQLDSWQQWQKLFELAHFVVLRRPPAGEEPSAASAVLTRFVAARVVSEVAELERSQAGKVLFLDNIELEISSSMIREAIAAGKDVRGMLAPQTYEIILRHHLYGIDKSPQTSDKERQISL